MMPVWVSLMFLVGIPFALAIVIVAWIIDHVWLTPKEAKIIKKAARKKKPLVIMGSDDGYADFEILENVGREGYASTSKKQKGKWIGFFARSIQDESTDSEAMKEEEQKKEKKLGRLINKLSSRKLFLRNAKVPVWFSYSGKAILTSLYSLIGAEATKEIAENINPVVINLTDINRLFPDPWDESQQIANETDAKIEALYEGKKFFGMEGLKYFVLPGMIIIAIMVLAIIFLVLGK